MKRKKIILWTLIILGAVLIIPNMLIKKSAKGKTYDSVESMPKRKVGLVLGCIKTLANNRVNLYYKYRLDAAVALFKARKIEYILVSGDNGSTSYDEPSVFKADLMAQGIPEHRIYLDYAGFRTLDSVVRAKAIFGQSEYIIISQKFHNARAIFLAQHHDMDAIAYNAKDVIGRYSIKTQLREYLAGTKAAIDILFQVEPKFYGKKIQIGL